MQAWSLGSLFAHKKTPALCLYKDESISRVTTLFHRRLTSPASLSTSVYTLMPITVITPSQPTWNFMSCCSQREQRLLWHNTVVRTATWFPFNAKLRDVFETIRRLCSPFVSTNMVLWLTVRIYQFPCAPLINRLLSVPSTDLYLFPSLLFLSI